TMTSGLAAPGGRMDGGRGIHARGEAPRRGPGRPDGRRARHTRAWRSPTSRSRATGWTAGAAYTRVEKPHVEVPGDRTPTVVVGFDHPLHSLISGFVGQGAEDLLRHLAPSTTVRSK